MKRMSQLQYHFGTKIRFYPSYRQMKIIKVNSDVSRFIYNHLVANKRKLSAIRRTFFWNGMLKQHVIHNYRKTLKQSIIRKRHKWLQDKYIDGYAIAKVRQNNSRAYSNWHKGLQNCPTWHRKRDHPYEDRYQTACDRHNIRFLDSRHLRMPKLGRVHLASVRNIILEHLNSIRIGTVSIYKNPIGHYYISLQLASDSPFVSLKPKTHRKLAYDLNLSNFFYASDGKEVPNPRYYTRGLPRLKKIEQRVSRRRRRAMREHRNFKTCRGYQRARRRLAGWQIKVRNRRHNFLEYWSTVLVKSQDLIVGEDLRSKNMLKNHRLAQKISDAGFRSFITMLQYKTKLYGKHFVLIDPCDTTQRCHNCGYICNREDGTHIKLGIEKWTCPKCGAHHIRDYNASLNIMDKGIIKIKINNLISRLALVRMATRAKSSSKIWFSLIGLLHVITVPDRAEQGTAD